MMERDLYGNIRKKLTDVEVQAPDFDLLFGEETLGGDAMRTIIASKLADHAAEAPDFDLLFAGETLIKPVKAPKIHLFPWWSIAGVAAACLAVFFLLPKQLGTEVEQLSKAPETETIQAPVKRVVKAKSTFMAKQQTHKLLIPTSIKPISLQSKKTTNTSQTSIDTTSETANADVSETTNNQIFTKISPSRSSQLNVKSNRSVQEAYAAARIRKGRSKPDRMSFGFGMNSANRLLSVVNSRSDGGFALQSVASSASDGYSNIEGASTSLLRTTNTSANEWVGPDNITAAMLQNCQTNYLLPINFGLTVSIPIIRDLNIITGLQYTYIANHISGNTFDLKQELHYLGIPVKISVNLVKRGNFMVYSALGGTIEKGLVGVQHSTVEGEGEWSGTQSIEGFQTSLTGQFGLSYNLNSKFLLYIEPGVAWYIPSDQPVCNRTEEPFNFNLSLGIRYHLQ